MVNAAQCHGIARERKGSAREEKGRAAENERKKKMGMERMGKVTPWRIFDFTNYTIVFGKTRYPVTPSKGQTWTF